MHINFLKKKKKRQGIEIKLHKLLLQPIRVKFSLSFNRQRHYKKMVLRPRFKNAAIGPKNAT